MEMRRRALGPATARWSDYVGTVAADDADAVLDAGCVGQLVKGTRVQESGCRRSWPIVTLR
ncbi:MAG: hypothetical protein JWP61_2963 [Friedmanniella sp.]|jgi:hypothetical protein|nr:hypothetical protein [Friedmanniella sp.]